MEGEAGRLRVAIVETARRMEHLGLTRGSAGNVSARAGSGFLITPSGLSAAALTPAGIVALDLDGGHAEGARPSSEWRMHRDLYRERPEAMAVVHTHSPHATALACLRRDIPAFHYMVAVAGGTDVRCAAYAAFGTPALSRAVLAAMRGRTACLLANHGALAIGASLEDALERALELEALAQQYLLALAAGEPVILGEAEMAEVLQRFDSYRRGRGSRA